MSERPTPDEPDEATEPLEVPIDGTLDLHTFAPRDLPDVLDGYFDACREKGILSLRVIHGKGSGMQKARVEKLLAKDPRVRSFRTAGIGAGGWGATLVELHPL
ncbi:Smr/MutS family protein [Vulgatibacter sp.]|uniref:Smr/MutS family protein n=1 Tax=Vulgatibacter sp. TaxID=1971226 RepID=UPI0035661DC5